MKCENREAVLIKQTPPPHLPLHHLPYNCNSNFQYSSSSSSSSSSVITGLFKLNHHLLVKEQQTITPTAEHATKKQIILLCFKTRAKKISLC
ncbi:unnamed protein product [Coffea canephora]|uniref:Uncharacterized protein n=1 Tax=Coffea canephora TaxID=49390 RepID=A0A068UG69_COFCA|nr:unnamed protein product [Coffea canephora]